MYKLICLFTITFLDKKFPSNIIFIGLSFFSILIITSTSYPLRNASSMDWRGLFISSVHHKPKLQSPSGDSRSFLIFPLALRFAYYRRFYTGPAATRRRKRITMDSKIADKRSIEEEHYHIKNGIKTLCSEEVGAGAFPCNKHPYLLLGMGIRPESPATFPGRIRKTNSEEHLWIFHHWASALVNRSLSQHRRYPAAEHWDDDKVSNKFRGDPNTNVNKPQNWTAKESYASFIVGGKAPTNSPLGTRGRHCESSGVIRLRRWNCAGFLHEQGPHQPTSRRWVRSSCGTLSYQSTINTDWNSTAAF